MAEQDNVLTKIHDLLLYTVPQFGKFPRDQKFLLGDRIETKMLEALEHCLRAYYQRDKRPHLLEANMAVEIIRHLVRIACGLRCLPPKGSEVISERVDEVGRMIGGWMKQARVAVMASGKPGGQPE